MSKKRILTIGLELASAEVEEAEFESKQSLLDWDIVLFKPQLLGVLPHDNQYYQGKPSFSERASFRLRASCEHWRREIKQAVEAGKTVIVFAAKLEEVFVDTGERSHSGTGRNQKTTIHVSGYDNYCSIPAKLSPIESSGSAMKLSARGAGVLAPYWKEFEGNSRYQLIFSGPNVPDCVLTRAGDKPVGAIYKSKSSAGTLLVLPDIDFYADQFLAETKSEDESEYAWTPAAEQFAARMLASIVALDGTLRSEGELTPEPQWAADEKFVLEPERSLKAQLLEAEGRVERAQRQKEELEERVKAAAAYRALLFERGKPLENAVIAALRLLRFSATPFRSSDSEFDVVFESDEGRLIGEAEGKDSKPVNVEKLRQLSMNIQEDLERDDVTSPAKPVLLGNAFRLQPLTGRGDPFTEKCKSAALMSSTALVFTPDLFFVVRYLLRNVDPDYACECRRAILDGIGRVTFPKPPDSASSGDVQVEESKPKKV